MSKLTAEYKAELLVRSSPSTTAIRITINGGCNLASKCQGFGDYVAEQIQMPLPNSGTITASWTPRKYIDGTTFTATFAGYKKQNDSFRFDNAHDRDVLHMDSYYKGQGKKHEWNLNLPDLKMINRRRVAVIQLMRVLEDNVAWQIPVWFYMPWCMWWQEYTDFPHKLYERKPRGFRITDFCEAVMAYVSLHSDGSELVATGTGIAKQTVAAIEEAIDRVTFSLEKTGIFEFERILFGRTIILPFMMYAPPGSRLEGPNKIIGGLVRD